MPVRPRSSHVPPDADWRAPDEPQGRWRAEALTLDEEALFQAARFGQTINTRYALTTILGGIAIVDYLVDVSPASWQTIAVIALIACVANTAAHVVHRRRAVARWHFWAMLVFDVLAMGASVAVFGRLGALGIPFFIVAIGAYGLGLPGAANALCALACIVYPAARVIGLAQHDGVVPVPLLVVETGCLIGLSWLALRGPVRFTHRVRRARHALAALERSEFDVRLPARAFDDLGLLASSFNRTAEALGTSVHALRESRARLEATEAQARDMAARMRAVAATAAGVLAAGSPESLQVVLHDACREVLPLDAFTFGLYDADAHTLCFPSDPWFGATSCTVPLAGKPSERVVRERRSLLTLRADDPRGHGALLIGDARRSESVIRTPILAGDAVVAVMSVQSYARDAYGQADVDVLEAIAALASTALRNIRLVDALRTSQDELAHQAHHDPLTGLANRVRFRERLLAALATAQHDGRFDRVAVLVLDLDGFKRVNDSLGHAEGDRLLCAVSERLLATTGARACVARLGGDEFAMLVEHVDAPIVATRIAEDVLAALDAPFALGDTEVVVGVSIGIAQPSGSDGGAQLDALLRDADVAMYEAKGRGKQQYALFDPAMHAAAVRRLALEADLRHALDGAQLHVHYQPIVELATGAVVGVEALCRWQHPQRGAVSPAEFIPVAEETGLIVPIGRWVLRQACRQGAAWQARRAAAGVDEPLTMTVNVSGRQLDDPAFIDDVADAIAESGIAHGSLVLELTESMMIERPHEAREQLLRLKALGVRLAIDDFGTGYSALSYLRQFPLDVLKIDRSFVERVTRGGADAALARAVVGLGEALSLQCVAEGIETGEQERWIRELGCTHGQGWRFSRPQPAPALERLVVGVEARVAAVA